MLTYYELVRVHIKKAMFSSAGEASFIVTFASYFPQRNLR